MRKFIEADKLRAKMYHDAFETDSDEQKWDGGCWIRYKMFERNIDAMPAADVVEVTRCRECGHRKQYQFPPTYSVKDYCEKHEKVVSPNDYCSWAGDKDEDT